MANFTSEYVEVVNELWDEAVASVPDSETSRIVRRTLEAYSEDLQNLLATLSEETGSHDKWAMERYYDLGTVLDEPNEVEEIRGREEPYLDTHRELDNFFDRLSRTLAGVLTLEDQVVLFEGLSAEFNKIAGREKIAPTYYDSWGVRDEDWFPGEGEEDIDYGEGDSVNSDDHNMSDYEEIIKDTQKMMQATYEAHLEQNREIATSMNYPTYHAAEDYLFENEMHNAFPHSVLPSTEPGKPSPFIEILKLTPIGANHKQDELKIRLSFIDALENTTRRLNDELEGLVL